MRLDIGFSRSMRKALGSITSRRGTVALVAAALLAGPLGADTSGSGSYVSRPPQPTLIDTERYELGKAVFLGKLSAPGPGGDALRDVQRARLHQLQERLPVKVRRSVDLPGLAGTLSRDHVTALEYYLKIRFKVE
jgi:hypothetical protein